MSVTRTSKHKPYPPQGMCGGSWGGGVGLVEAFMGACGQLSEYFISLFLA